VQIAEERTSVNTTVGVGVRAHRPGSDLLVLTHLLLLLPLCAWLGSILWDYGLDMMMRYNVKILLYWLIGHWSSLSCRMNAEETSHHHVHVR
jgi:hypothetical protein